MLYAGGLPTRASSQENRMIVISRQRNESLVIGDNITITVIEIRGDKVRLGIEFPPDMPVHRQEVYDAICRSQTNQPAPPAAPPEPHLVANQIDRLDRFAAVLEMKVGVPITRQVVIEALREAGLEESQMQALLM
jgi:carbon storage regulator